MSALTNNYIVQDGHWLWQGSLNSSGYGPHRRYYEAKWGKLPEGLELDHKCRIRSCINPDCLEVVTRVVNIHRGTGHGTETHCPQGHEYTPENTKVRRGRRNCIICTRVYDRKRMDKEYWREFRDKKRIKELNQT